MEFFVEGVMSNAEVMGLCDEVEGMNMNMDSSRVLGHTPGVSGFLGGELAPYLTSVHPRASHLRPNSEEVVAFLRVYKNRMTPECLAIILNSLPDEAQLQSLLSDSSFDADSIRLLAEEVRLMRKPEKALESSSNGMMLDEGVAESSSSSNPPPPPLIKKEEVLSCAPSYSSSSL